MRVLIAPDKFKGTLTAHEVCNAIEAGLKEKSPDIECVNFPLADGGEGTMEILTQQSKGHFITIKAHDPLFRLVDASYGISGDGKTAFIEMASASGLRLLKLEEKNVMQASTYGTGELIKDALNKGVTHIVLGIGGSATNDGGAGAAHVLGYEFLDSENKPVNPTGENLVKIKSIQRDKIHPQLAKVKFTAVCDVDNPLTGKHGAAFIYGAQKGANPEQISLLDEGLKNLADVVQSQLKISIENIPGAGAGGGFGGGVVAFFNGSLRKGIDLVFDLTGFEEEVKKADVVITGEGKLDKQTLQGKVVAGVASLGKQYNKKVICIVGKNELSTSDVNNLGITMLFSLVDHAGNEDALKNAYNLLVRISKELVTLKK